MSINAFLCKRYKKEIITIEDIFPEIIFGLICVGIGIMYIKGAIFLYNNYTILDSQFVTISGFDILSIAVCSISSLVLGAGTCFIIIFYTVSYIMDIKIASCKRK